MIGKKVYGLDFGTRELKIYRRGKGIVVNEKDVIAIENKKKILAVGDEAFEMFEKAPDNVEIVFPVKNGVIADINYMEGLLSSFLKRVNNGKKASLADYVVAVPTDITDVQKRAFTDLIMSSNAKVNSIRIIEKPIAAALGADLDINNAHGVLIVDIGADTTEISVISLGGIVISRLLNIGGNTLDEAIAINVKKKCGLYIGQKTAEMLKIKIGSAFPVDEGSEMVFGRDVVTGLPVSKEVPSLLIYDAIYEYLANIIDSIRMILERTPPEISSDIIDSGIYLTGGCAHIKHLSELISKETELNVNICENSTDTVINGIKRVIEDGTYLKISSDFRKKYKSIS